MADQQIEDLTELTSLAATDEFIVNDKSDTTDDAGGTPKRILASTMGLLASSVTSSDADITGVVGTMHIADISGFTADRDFILPATAAVGDRVGVMLSVGDDAYELDIHTPSASSDTINAVDSSVGTASWSRLFIAGEVLVFRCVVANTAWVVETDGRIPSAARMSRPTAQSGFTSGAFTKSNVDTEDADVGDLGDTSNSRISIRRSGNYVVQAFGSITNMGDQDRIIVAAYVTGSEASRSPQIWQSVGGTTTGQAALSDELPLTAGDYVELHIYHDVGTSQSTGTTVNKPTISVREML